MSPAGRPLTVPIKKLIGFDKGMVAAINVWRKKQKEAPDFSEAVRQLIYLGLARPPGKNLADGPKRRH